LARERGEGPRKKSGATSRWKILNGKNGGFSGQFEYSTNHPKRKVVKGKRGLADPALGGITWSQPAIVPRPPKRVPNRENSGRKFYSRKNTNIRKTSSVGRRFRPDSYS